MKNLSAAALRGWAGTRLRSVVPDKAASRMLPLPEHTPTSTQLRSLVQGCPCHLVGVAPPVLPAHTHPLAKKGRPALLPPQSCLYLPSPQPSWTSFKSSGALGCLFLPPGLCKCCPPTHTHQNIPSPFLSSCLPSPPPSLLSSSPGECPSYHHPTTHTHTRAHTHTPITHT